MFVMSAGFGLLNPSDKVPCYSATFAPVEDRVAATLRGHRSVAEAHRAWWRAINAQRGVGERPLLQQLQGHDRILLGASHHYLMAVADDLNALAAHVGPGRLFVVASGVAPEQVPQPLRRCLLPLRSEIQRTVGGPRTTLNQRALLWLVETVVAEVGWDRAAIDGAIARARKQAAPNALPRRRVSDEQVKAWIAEQCAGQAELARPRLLARLREGGAACEQSRFARLLGEVRQVLEPQVLAGEEEHS